MNATEEIWRTYHDGLLNFLRSRVHYDIAEDILQDVFVKIHSKIDSLKESTKLESWVYQITRNAAIDYYRSSRTMEELPEWLEDDTPNPNDQVQQDLSSCLFPLIDRLPEKYRFALSRVEIEGTSQTELAKELGISISGAKSLVQRGRSQLKELLHDCCIVETNRLKQLVDYKQKKPSCKLCC